MTDEVLPDGGELFRLWALTEPTLVELVKDRVALTLAGGLAQIRYSIASDAAGQYGEGAPLLLIECWGPAGVDDGTASKVARRIAAAVHRLPGASVETGPYSSADPTSRRARFNLTVRLLTFVD